MARALHEKLKNHDGAGAGLLQVAIVECFQGKFKACHKTLYQFLAMIEDGRLGMFRMSCSYHHPTSTPTPFYHTQQQYLSHPIDLFSHTLHYLLITSSSFLAFQAATPRQLCLVAVGYHNLAVVQLKMQHSDLAAKSSQNARKIARLCLSCSTRYLAVFQVI